MGTDGESVRSLAEELRTLLGASGCSYTRIIYLGGRVGPRMRFTKSSLSGWFSGNAVPSNRADFDFLIELLEARAALRNSGHPRRSRGEWERLRRKAEVERRAAGRRTHPGAIAEADRAPVRPPPRESWLQDGPDDGGNSHLPVLQVPLAELEIHHAPLPGRTDRADDQPTPYLERSFDAELRTQMTAVLAGGSSVFAVLIGESSTGKTRALYEALVAVAPDRPLLRPAGSQDLLDLIEDGGIPPGSVLWLNESQRFLDNAHGEKAAAALHRLLRRQSGLLAVGTLWHDPYWRQLTQRAVPGDPHSHARALLTGPLSVPILLPAELSRAERREWFGLAQRRRDQRLLHALDAGRSDGRVIQHLSGGPELLSAYRAGPGRRFDHFEWELIAAALGARTLGHRTPLTAELLIDAADGELTSRQRTIDPDRALEAVSSADTHCVLPALVRVRASIRSQTRYEPADYLDQHSRARQILGTAALWEALATHATDPTDLGELAKSADKRGFHKLAVCLGKKAVLAGSHLAPAELIGRLTRPLDPLQEGARWVAAHASLTDPWAVAHLVRTLRSSGVPHAVDVLRDRTYPAPASNQPGAVVRQLEVLHDIGAERSLQLAAARAVAETEMTDPGAVAALLQILNTAGLRETSAHLLGRDPVGQAKLSPLAPLVDLLTALADANETHHFTALARRAVAEASLTDPRATASLLTALRDAGPGGAQAFAHLRGRRPAEQADLADPTHVADLLHTLYKLDEHEAHQVLAQRAADTVDVTDPAAVATVLLALHETQADRAVDSLLRRDPADLVSLSRPYLVHDLLDVLASIGQAPSFVRLAHRTAVEGDLTSANWTAALLRSLREAGANDIITQLLSRQPAEHADLSDQHLTFGGWSGLVDLVAELHAVADITGVDTLTRRIADEADLDDPVHVSVRLKYLHESGVPRAADALALRIAADTDVTHPSTTGLLLSALHEAHAAEAVDLLLRRGPSREADVTNPGIRLLLEALDQAGAHGAVEELLARDPAEHVDLFHPKDAARMVDTLQHLGAQQAAQRLTERVEEQGLAHPEGHDAVYGYEIDGRPAATWTWNDLD
ncbi:hypothetical protein [Streptomyces sp. NBC_01296]|uniref:hypothetical protein n=1 Tax=Streptomyces sp. NBC_01296 TaxID=2903816 RepID=UPI002E15EC59|nr:hypothetical protein OG299_42470 [Streptomyces sp. NBC_01296]